MKLDLSRLNLEEFIVKDGVINDVECILIQPQHIGTKWTQKNSIFRSSVWRKDNGELLSASYKKFVNWGENPDNFPLPINLNDCSVYEKIDGSTLIIDFINGKLSYRTRGTFNARQLDNGHEIEQIDLKYGNSFKNILKCGNYSIVCEWVSDKNIIILRYPNCPDVRLLNIIHKDDYDYTKQNTVDAIAQIRKIPRAKQCHFNSFEQLIKNVEAWQEGEGVCIYSKEDQEIHKAKSLKYLSLHRLKSELGSQSRLEELFFSVDPWMTKAYFIQYLNETFDFEIAEACKHNIDQMFPKIESFQSYIKDLNIFFGSVIEPVIDKLSRKELATLILQSSYAKLNTLLFSKLDRKNIDNGALLKYYNNYEYSQKNS